MPLEVCDPSAAELLSAIGAEPGYPCPCLTVRLDVVAPDLVARPPAPRRLAFDELELKVIPQQRDDVLFVAPVVAARLRAVRRDEAAEHGFKLAMAAGLPIREAQSSARPADAGEL